MWGESDCWEVVHVLCDWFRECGWVYKRCGKSFQVFCGCWVSVWVCGDGVMVDGLGGGVVVFSFDDPLLFDGLRLAVSGFGVCDG